MFAIFIYVLRRLLQRDQRTADESRTPTPPWSVNRHSQVNRVTRDSQQQLAIEASEGHHQNIFHGGVFIFNQSK